MVRAVAAPAGRPSLAAVRAWWRVRHPPPSLGQRLDIVYTAAIVSGILGLLAYGTASSALAQVVSPHWLASFGPPLALLGVVVTAHWGAYQGPVVFSVADVMHLLGAPLPRRALAARRLGLALAGGAAAGALAAGLLVVGLAGEGRGVAAGRALGLTGGLAELGVLAVAGAWAVERSERWERAVRRATWPAVLLAVALAAAADAGGVGREIARWSGPWGWAVQPGTGAGLAAWLVALAVLTLATAVAAVAALRDCGGCPTERHLRRAEGRASAIASLSGFDARTARRALESVGARPAGGGAPALLGRLRAALAARRATSTMAIVWRDALAAARAPGRVAEAAALAGAGTTIAVLNADHPVAVAAAAVLVYFGASRMLGPMRSELDAADRARVLLLPRLGRILLAHAIVPVVAITAAALLAAAGCAVAGALPSHGGAAAAAAVAAAPMLTGCAAMSARRGGRMPHSLLVTAVAADPSGGGLTLLWWVALWPAVGAVLGGVPVLLATGAGSGAAVVAVGWIALATAALARVVAREPAEQ